MQDSEHFDWQGFCRYAEISMTGRLGRNNPHRHTQGIPYYVWAIPTLSHGLNKSTLGRSIPRLKYQAPEPGEETITIPHLLVLQHLGYLDEQGELTDKPFLTVVDGINSLNRLREKGHYPFDAIVRSYMVNCSIQWPYALVGLELFLSRVQSFDTLAQKEQEDLIEIGWALSFILGTSETFILFEVGFMSINFNVPMTAILPYIKRLDGALGLPRDMFDQSVFRNRVLNTYSREAFLNSPEIRSSLFTSGTLDVMLQTALPSQYEGDIPTQLRDFISPVIGKIDTDRYTTEFLYKAMAEEAPDFLYQFDRMTDALLVHPLDARMSNSDCLDSEMLEEDGRNLDSLDKSEDSERDIPPPPIIGKDWTNRALAEYVGSMCVNYTPELVKVSLCRYVVRGLMLTTFKSIAIANVPEVNQRIQPLLQAQPDFDLNDFPVIARAFDALAAKVRAVMVIIAPVATIADLEEEFCIEDRVKTAIEAATASFSRGSFSSACMDAFVSLSGCLANIPAEQVLLEDAQVDYPALLDAIDVVGSPKASTVENLVATTPLLMMFLQSYRQALLNQDKLDVQDLKAKSLAMSALELEAQAVVAMITRAPQPEVVDSEKPDEASKANAALKARLDDSTRLLEERRQENIALRERVRQLEQEPPAKPVKETHEPASGGTAVPQKWMVSMMLDMLPNTTPVAVLEAAAKASHGKLQVLPSAYESAKQYGRTEYSAVNSMMSLIKLWKEYLPAFLAGGDNKARKVFGEKFSACESDTVMNSERMRRMREFDVHGTTMLITAHLALSRFLRLYFRVDKEKGVIQVVYFGEHLETATSS